MKCLSICAAGFLFGKALFVFEAMAARLPTSTLVVRVLSVDQELFHRDRAPVVGEQWLESTGFVAKVRIQNVIRTDHGLAPGETIKVHYTICTANSLPLPHTATPLKPGENVTLEVFGHDDEYQRR